MHIYIIRKHTTTDHHHTVQDGRLQVQFLRQRLEEETPPTQDATTTCASGMFAPVERREISQAQGAKVRTQGAKVRASISASRYGMQQQHATTTTTTTSDRIGPAQHDAAISATCVRARLWK